MEKPPTRSKEEILQFLEVELRGNLQVLIDPKKKDSFSQARIISWINITKERIYYHLIENQ